MAVSAVFLWLGFVCAISFMEAWLKFQAPGITIPLGLGIGRLVFGALNKVEWVLCAIILIALFAQKNKKWKQGFIWIVVPLVILVFQTIYLLPALDRRAGIFLAGSEPPESKLHLYFVAVELIKVMFLSLFGMSQFQKLKENYGRTD